MLALAAAGAIAVFAAVGISVDAGHVVATRTRMQSTADAAALAAAEVVPNRGLSIDTAHLYVRMNSGEAVADEVTVSTTVVADDTVTVVTGTYVPYSFMRAVGLPGTDVAATATARRGFYSGGTGIIPWGFIQSNDPDSALLQNACYLGTSASGVPIFKTRTSCTLKFGSGYHGGGDFGALRLDPGDSGSSDYRERVEEGSRLPHRVGEVVDSETGNMQGPTSDGVEYRLEQPAPTGCGGTSRNAVLKDNANGTVTIRPGCETSARIVVIPVVDQIDDNKGSRILGFVTMFLLSQSGSGGQSTVQGEFIRVVTRLPGGEYSGTDITAASAVFLER